ncbi:MAG: hypothetical protein GX154_08210 [Clostridiales bacterium]|nr:hypothetical protein [Clostridiales bacterium]
MYLEQIFIIQKKFNKGVLAKIINRSKQKELIIKKIGERAAEDDFLALYVVSLNRNFFDEDIVSVNDFKLNAISEIVNIMNKKSGDTEFQNEIINYLMQVKDKDFLIYVLDNLLINKKHFTVRNIQVFISTLSTNFKSSKLDNKQKRKLMDVIYKHFLMVEEELQEILIRMMEILKITDIYKAAEMFMSVGQPIKKRLIDAIKSSITIKRATEIISKMDLIQYDLNMDSTFSLLFIIAIEKYKLYEVTNTIIELKKRKILWDNVLAKLQELIDDNLIDSNKFAMLLELAERNLA